MNENENVIENNNHTNTNTKNQSLCQMDVLYLWLTIFLNIVIVGTVNGLYVWSTLKNLSYFYRFMIQLSLSLFNTILKSLLRSIFPIRIKYSLLGVWSFSLIGVMNGVLIPCVVTTLTSPNCYQVSIIYYFFPLLIFYLFIILIIDWLVEIISETTRYFILLYLWKMYFMAYFCGCGKKNLSPIFYSKNGSIETHSSFHL